MAEVDRAALLAALRLQMEWGADEALAEAPLDRTAPAAALPPAGAAFPVPATVRPAAVPPLARPPTPGNGGLLIPAAAPPAVSRAAELAAAAGSLDALREAMAGRTTFIIAHRLSTIALADEIVVLEHGRIAARGTHEELLETSELYAEIAEKGLPDQVFLNRDPRERVAEL